MSIYRFPRNVCIIFPACINESSHLQQFSNSSLWLNQQLIPFIEVSELCSTYVKRGGVGR